MLLHTSVLLIIAAFCFTSLVGNRDSIKNTLLESGIYNNFVKSTISDNLSSQGDSSIPLDDEAIQAIVTSAFKPSELKEASEKVIDGVYDWLEGSTDEPEFVVDFSTQKELMAQEISNYAATRIDSLPTCVDSLPDGQDIFSIECRPYGYFAADIKQQVYDDLVTGDFLKNPVFTSSDLPMAENGESIGEKFSSAPFIYNVFTKSVYISLALFAVVSAAYVYVRRPLNKGFKSLGKDLLGNGVVLILFTVLFGFILPKYFNSFQIQSGDSTALLNGVTDAFVNRLDTIIINVAIQIAALGLMILILRSMMMSGRGRYDGVKSKSGLVSGVSQESVMSKTKLRSKPPIQTSEDYRSRKISKQKSKRYRRIKP